MVPIPLLSGSSLAMRRIARLARSMARRTLSESTVVRPLTESTATCAATSPALAPPIPSATARMRLLATERSSLW